MKVCWFRLWIKDGESLGDLKRMHLILFHTEMNRK